MNEEIQLVLILMIVSTLFMISIIAQYIIEALILKTLAKIEGKLEILAWIPIANIYLLFELTDTIPYLVLIYALQVVGIIGLAISMGFNIFVAIKWGKLCEMHDIDSNLVYLGIIIPLVALFPKYQLYKKVKLQLNS